MRCRRGCQENVAHKSRIEQLGICAVFARCHDEQIGSPINVYAAFGDQGNCPNWWLKLPISSAAALAAKAVRCLLRQPFLDFFRVNLHHTTPLARWFPPAVTECPTSPLQDRKCRSNLPTDHAPGYRIDRKLS